jgi:hypothetical protein
MQQGDGGSSEMDGGGNGNNRETNKPDVFITGAMPNKQLKNRVTYDHRTPTGTSGLLDCLLA